MTIGTWFARDPTFLKKAAKEKEVQIKILEQVTNIKSNHDSRLNHIQQQLMQLSERESQINQVN